MEFAWSHVVPLDRIDEELRLAVRPTPELFSTLAVGASQRLARLGATGPASRIERLIAAEAWTDASIALIELEIPAWKVRRLVQEGGEWLCSLSRQENLPITLDDTAEARHESLPLAILRAFVEARRKSFVAPRAVLAAVPRVQPASERLICCDNYS